MNRTPIALHEATFARYRSQLVFLAPLNSTQEQLITHPQLKEKVVAMKCEAGIFIKQSKTKLW